MGGGGGGGGGGGLEGVAVHGVEMMSEPYSAPLPSPCPPSPINPLLCAIFYHGIALTVGVSLI